MHVISKPPHAEEAASAAVSKHVPAGFQLCSACSERLSDTEIEHEGAIPFSGVDRGREVDADRPDGGQVAQAEPCSDARPLRQIWDVGGVSAPDIDERHDLNRLGDLDARLDRALEQ